jgi:transcriptional regulator with XRE-family HTH domain
MSILIGEKIKFFRERSGLGQYYFEEIVGIAHGSLSRIEKGKTNPTKETIHKIAAMLNLTNTEIMYLNGTFDEDATKDEINNAIFEVKYILDDPKTFAYLLDDKRRIVSVSEGFRGISSVSNLTLENIIGQNILEFICEQSSIHKDDFFIKDIKKMLVLQLSRLIYDSPYIFFEDYWKDLIFKLRENKVFAEAWDIVNSKDYRFDIFNIESRTIQFLFNGFEVNLVYAEEFLRKNQRFHLSLYFSNNNLIDFLVKFQ